MENENTNTAKIEVEELGDGFLFCPVCKKVVETSDHGENDIWCKGNPYWIQGPFYRETGSDQKIELAIKTLQDVLQTVKNWNNTDDFLWMQYRLPVVIEKLSEES